MNWLVPYLFQILSIIQFSFCLRLTLLKVPESRPAGYDVRLSCDIDLEGEVLYTIRWFHNGKEFYRFSPNEDPSAMFFPSRGINPEVNRSTNTSVVLQHVDVYSAGHYRCEVLADAPHFHTVTAEAFMVVGEFYNNASGKRSLQSLVAILFLFLKFYLLEINY